MCFVCFLSGVARGREGEGAGWRKTRVISFCVIGTTEITEEPRHLRESIRVSIRPSYESKQLTRFLPEVI